MAENDVPKCNDREIAKISSNDLESKLNKLFINKIIPCELIGSHSVIP
tara:strand:+ start:34 stop:177 length:144 start_codon:yes stop_codon:yes gene_type:complete